jgi:RNase P/RNase MRP subunit p30
MLQDLHNGRGKAALRELRCAFHEKQDIVAVHGNLEFGLQFAVNHGDVPFLPEQLTRQSAAHRQVAACSDICRPWR